MGTAASTRSRRQWPLTALVVLVYIFLVAPSLIVIIISFGDTDEYMFPPRRLSFYIYQLYFNDVQWLNATRQSFIVAGLTMVLSMAVALPAAYATARFTFFMRAGLNYLLILPAVVPNVVIAVGLYFYLGQLGLNGTTTGLVLGHTLIAAPFSFIMILAGLRQVDPNLEAAARIMGASELRVLTRVTIPLLLPSIVGGALIAFLMSFDEFIIAFFISSSATETLPVRMFAAIRWEISPIIAAVSSLLTLVSLVAVMLVTLGASRKRAAPSSEG